MAFVNDQNGTVAVIFGLSLTVMCLFVGVAVDSARGVNTERDLSDLLDAAAIAGARAMTADGADDAEVKKIVNAYIAGSTPRTDKHKYVVNQVAIDIDREAGSVRVSAKGDMPTYFGAIAGIDKFELSRASAAQFKVHDIELSMMLDVTGSMSGSKIADLKVAAKDLVDILIDNEPKPYKVRLSIVPYAESVNAGDLAQAVKGNSGSIKSTCVSERKKKDAGFTDESPKVKQLGNKATSCPNSTVMPLTDDKDALLAKIDSLSTGGYTAGHLGTAWAWYMLSPNWADVLPSDSEPAPYEDGKTLKVVVLMTDGAYNKEYELADNGNSNIQARALCDNIKSADVQVFTIGFAMNPKDLPTMQYCASSPSQFFDAQDQGQLRAAFRQIAEQVTALRLTQ